MSQAEAGKGSAPRQQQDREAYATGWDRIFKKDQEKKPEVPEKKEE